MNENKVEQVNENVSAADSSSVTVTPQKSNPKLNDFLDYRGIEYWKFMLRYNLHPKGKGVTEAQIINIVHNFLNRHLRIKHKYGYLYDLGGNFFKIRKATDV